MSYYEPESRGLYRTRDNIIFGVCGGIAEYLDVSVFWTRALAVLVLLCTGIWPTVFLYLGATLLMKRSPYARWTS